MFHKTLEEIELEKKTKTSDMTAAGVQNPSLPQSSSYKSKPFKKDNKDLNNLKPIYF